MKNIRLVGLDLDGSLLNDAKKITAATRAALDAAAAQGVFLVPITGRPSLGIPATVRDLPFVRYIVSCNGACIHDQQEDTLLRERLIARADSLALVSLLQGAQLPFEVLYEGVGYAEPWVYERLIARNPQSKFLPQYIKDTRRTVPHMLSFVEERRGLEELFVIAADPQVVEELSPKLHALETLHMVNPAPGAWEITAKGVDKGDALLYLAAHLGLDATQCMAIGDSGNDLAMLRAAGLGVAMGNASRALKAEADFVTESNECDGVAAALSRFVLN